MTVVIVAALASCAPPDPGETTIRLVELFDEATIEDSPELPVGEAASDELRFLDDAYGVAELKRDGDRLVGRSTRDLPIVRLERLIPDEAQQDDDLQRVELRLRVSEGANLAMTFSDSAEFDVSRSSNRSLWPLRSPIAPGDTIQSYVLTPTRSIPRSSIRYIDLSPTDATNAEFEIESVRLVFRREHLASIPSGVGWQGFGGIYRETIVSRSPETIAFDMTLPDRPRLELAIATIDDGPVTFRIGVQTPGSDEVKSLLEKTVTMSERWEQIDIPLDDLSGENVTLSLLTEAGAGGAIGFWGAPAVRSTSPDSPAVILFVTDTLRRDRLSTYGHDRDTSPVLTQLAAEGALFLDNQAQATWTKVSMPSLLTSLYPTTHGVVDFSDRIPASATTIAEPFREAGYATLAVVANDFVGRATNLHQGFEVFHEAAAVPESIKDARAFIDRVLPWIEAHRDVPFFVLVHVTDPHWTYPSYPPYDTLWADPDARRRHEERTEKVRPLIQWPFMRGRGLPSKTELQEAGIDWREFVAPELDWYDGAIRGVDVEIGRLVETLRNAGLQDRTILAFTSDHGEEFLEHGSHWHGRNAYGENSNVPLVLWAPGKIPAGMTVTETVQNIDVMPTLLELSGLDVPEGLQGQSLLPLLTENAPSRWRRRPAIVERIGNSADNPENPDAFAMVSDGFRLVKLIDSDGNVDYELYDHENDPLNLENIAESNQDVVERLSAQLEEWHEWARSARMPSDEEAAEGMSADQLERLRSLGYVQ